MSTYCALCQKRPASALTDWDGRQVPACRACLAPVPEPASVSDDLHRRVLRAARHFDQFTASEMVIALDVSPVDAPSLRRAVHLLARSGALRIVSEEARRMTFQLTELGRKRAA